MAVRLNLNGSQEPENNFDAQARDRKQETRTRPEKPAGSGKSAAKPEKPDKPNKSNKPNKPGKTGKIMIIAAAAGGVLLLMMILLVLMPSGGEPDGNPGSAAAEENTAAENDPDDAGAGGGPQSPVEYEEDGGSDAAGDPDIEAPDGQDGNAVSANKISYNPDAAVTADRSYQEADAESAMKAKIYDAGTPANDVARQDGGGNADQDTEADAAVWDISADISCETYDDGSVSFEILTDLDPGEGVMLKLSDGESYAEISSAVADKSGRIRTTSFYGDGDGVLEGRHALYMCNSSGSLLASWNVDVSDGNVDIRAGMKGSSVTYVTEAYGMTYHDPECALVRDTNLKNKGFTDATAEYLEDAGYDACATCIGNRTE